MQLKINALRRLKNNYYFSSFFWSTFQKVLTAIIGFISTPLLLEYYGKAEFGVLSIATACNGYMHLLDLGMNTGAVKYFSQWRTENKISLIERVARTNISFYFIISIINILGIVLLAIFGRNLFSISDEEFDLLRSCLFILALFNLFSWATTTFNQLLVANMQMAYTMKVQSIVAILKALLIVSIFTFKLSITQYFFFLSFLVTVPLIPYIVECKKLNLIRNIAPAFYWNDFKVVIYFSLSIFALSIFQMTAVQSRPIVLSTFAADAANVVADFKIIETIPTFIIIVSGTFSGIFLPKTSELIAKGKQEEISNFAYKWTSNTSIITNILTIPFILCAKEALSAYVGSEYSYLKDYLIIWLLTVLVQMHTTPGNALVLGYGKTKMLVISTAIFCIISIFINIILVDYYNSGAAVIGYLIYVILVIGLYYLYYYKKLLKLSRIKMLVTFLRPTIIGIALLIVIDILNRTVIVDVERTRFEFICICMIKSIVWLLAYILLLYKFKMINIKDFQK